MTASIPQRKKMHPHKFTLYLAMGSIAMMFAGFTSAYIVKRNQAQWRPFDMPLAFWYSTAVILLSSLTIHLAMKAHQARRMQQYKVFLVVTSFLGLLFAFLQWKGFEYIHTHGFKMIFEGSTPSSSFLGAIAGVHILHIIGGVIVLAVLLVRSFSQKVKTYSSNGIEVASIYWHFVDAIWIYLFLFFNLING